MDTGQTIKLVVSVEKRPFLYDKSDPGYSNRNLLNAEWIKNIGEEICCNGLRIRLSKQSDDELLANDRPVKKVPMTPAERSRNYRERLKSRADYNLTKEKHVMRNQLYRLRKKDLITDEEAEEIKARTRERVRKHRERKRAEAENNSFTTPNKKTPVLTRKQKMDKKRLNVERKRKERSQWTPQKWRRHREKCRNYYHDKKARNKILQEQPSNIEVTATPQKWSKRSEYRAIRKVCNSLPADRERQSAVMRGVMRTLGSTVPLHDSDSDIKIKLERNMKRVIAKQILKKSKHNRSKAAEVFGLNNTYLYRLIKKKDVDCLRQKSTGTVKRHHEVKDFYLSPENSTQLSQKNKVKNDMPVFVLKETLDVLYTLYQSKVDMPVSRSLFKKLRPKNVRLAKSEIFNQCLCEVCENIQLMLKTINMYIPVSKRLRSNRDACRAMLCEEDGGSFSKLDCITGDCLLCGSKKLHSYLTLEGQELTVSWKKWENNQQTKKKMLVEKSATFQEMIQEFEKEMESYPLHQFRAQWQLKEFAQVRANPPAESCISVLDFAENYRCLLQDEIQSAHWSYSQVTLHPFVDYYSCHDCNKIITDVITIVSDDLKHDTEAVRIFSHKVYGHLSSKGYVFKRIIQWTDGCGAQYKCKDAFRDLTQMDEWARNVERNFFGSRHGKNACDGESAVTKRTVTQAVKSRRVVVQSAIDFFAFCKTHLVKPDYIDDVCCHYRRNFILVESAEISREDRDELYPVKGTRNLHNVKSNGARKLLVRSLSCFCHGCETDQNCFNNSHVQPWMDVELKVKHKKHDDRASPSTTVVGFMEREEPVTNDAQNLDQADDPEMQTFFASLVDVVSEEHNEGASPTTEFMRNIIVNLMEREEPVTNDAQIDPHSSRRWPEPSTQ